MIEIEIYETAHGKRPFKEWVKGEKLWQEVENITII
jgi:hypothetical protein